MRLLLLLVILMLVVAGGGFGVWWFGMRGEDSPMTAEDAPEPAERQGSAFVELSPLSFPVMHEGRVTRLKTMVVSLEVAGREPVQLSAEDRVRLRDAMLTELHGLYGLRFVREGDRGLDFVKQRLLGTSQRVLGDDVRGVFIQAVETQETNG